MKNFMTTKPKSKPIDPFQYALSGTEDAIQIAIFMWAQQNLETYPDLLWMHAIPNGMHTPNKRAAGRMRAMGMKRGVCDIFLPVKRGEFSGLYIELKKNKKGKVSDEQDDFMDYVKSQGFGAIVCYSLEEAVKMLVEYLNYKKLEPVKIVSKMTAQDKQMFGGW